MTFAEFFTLLIVGLIAGLLASVVMKGGGYGLFGNIVLGIVGAVMGGGLFGMLGVTTYGFLGRVVSGTVGAILLVGLGRVITGSPAPARR